MKDWQSQAHVKWECKYHVVIVPKYREKKHFKKHRAAIGQIIRNPINLCAGHKNADIVHCSQVAVSLSMEAIMNVKDHHTTKELQTLYRTQKDARLARRIHAVYLAGKGLSCPEIMTITGAGRRTIQQWVRKYNKHRIDGLRDKPRPGQPTKLPRKAESRFCKRIEAGPTKKDGVSVLNGPAIRRILEREFGVLYSRQGLYDLLHRLGYSCLCPRPQHEKADPQAQEQFKKTSSTCWIKSNQPIGAEE